MTTFYRLRPEVPGGLGTRTQLDPATHPPTVTQLHFEFAGWDGDDLVESFPCYLISESLASALQVANLDGFGCKEVEVTLAPQFVAFFPEAASSLPQWVWLVPTGAPWHSDVWLDERAQLHGSDKFIDIVNRFNISHCEISEVNAPGS